MTLHQRIISVLITFCSLGTITAHAAVQKENISQNSVKNIVLVHGLFADGSSWSKVIPILQEKGFNVTAVQNPTTSLDEDVEVVKRTLAQQNGPTILVAHSYGW